MSGRLIYLLLLATLLAQGSGKNRRRNIDGAPIIESDHAVQFYLLEAAYPYNVPDNIVDVMGVTFENYETPYAGLGVWDITADEKYTIEFRCNNYVGALLPNLHEDGSIKWNNQATVKITNPATKSDWTTAILIATSTGFAYEQLIDYLDEHKHKWQHYQPVAAVYIDSTATTADYNSKQLKNKGYIKVKAKNSYWFVDKLVNQLNDYGCQVQSFLHVPATSFAYRVRSNNNDNNNDDNSNSNDDDGAVVTEVHWDSEDGPANPDVYQWYDELTACYRFVFNATAYNGGGASYFLQSVRNCYGGYAFIYRSETSVYNVSLYTNDTDPDAMLSPLLSQYTYALPDGDNSNDNNSFSPFDIAVIVFAFLLFCGAGCYLSSKLCRRKKRRRVSFEGERAAQRAVETILSNNSNYNSNSSSSSSNNDRSSYYDNGSGRESFKTYYHGSRSADISRGSFFSNVYSQAIQTLVSNRNSSISAYNDYNTSATGTTTGSTMPYLRSDDNDGSMTLDESQHRFNAATAVNSSVFDFNPRMSGTYSQQQQHHEERQQLLLQQQKQQQQQSSGALSSLTRQLAAITGSSNTNNNSINRNSNSIVRQSSLAEPLAAEMSGTNTAVSVNNNSSSDNNSNNDSSGYMGPSLPEDRPPA